MPLQFNSSQGNSFAARLDSGQSLCRSALYCAYLSRIYLLHSYSFAIPRDSALGLAFAMQIIAVPLLGMSTHCLCLSLLVHAMPQPSEAKPSPRAYETSSAV